MYITCFVPNLIPVNLALILWNIISGWRQQKFILHAYLDKPAAKSFRFVLIRTTFRHKTVNTEKYK